MKKSFLLISILCVVLSVFTSSCDTDDPVLGDEPGQLVGEYELYMDGELTVDGSTGEVGMVQAPDESYNTIVTISKDKVVSIMVTGFSKSIGETTEIDGSDITVTITGENLLNSDGVEEMYFAKSGTIKRDSESKISFEGECTVILGQNPHQFSGFVKSDAFEVIK